MDNALVFMGRLVMGGFWLAVMAGYTAPFWLAALIVIWLAS